MSRVFAGIAGDHLDAAYSMAALPFTVSALVKLAVNATSQRLIDIGTTSTNRYSLTIGVTDLVSAHHHDGTLSTAASTASPTTDGGWHLWAATFVSLSSRNAFSDGINKGSNGGTRTLLTPTLLVVGQDLAGASRMNGKVAHLAIWGGTVSDADIATLANVSPNMIRPDILLDYWPLQSNNASEPSYGSRGTVLTVTGTSFSTDDPLLNQGIIQPMYYQKKTLYFV